MVQCLVTKREKVTKCLRFIQSKLHAIDLTHKTKKKEKKEREDKSSMHPKHLVNIGTVVEKM